VIVRLIMNLVVEGARTDPAGAGGPGSGREGS
jgi:hypothetical protein